MESSDPGVSTWRISNLYLSSSSRYHSINGIGGWQCYKSSRVRPSPMSRYPPRSRTCLGLQFPLTLSCQFQGTPSHRQFPRPPFVSLLLFFPNCLLAAIVAMYLVPIAINPPSPTPSPTLNDAIQRREVCFRFLPPVIALSLAFHPTSRRSILSFTLTLSPYPDQSPLAIPSLATFHEMRLSRLQCPHNAPFA